MAVLRVEQEFIEKKFLEIMIHPTRYCVMDMLFDFRETNNQVYCVSIRKIFIPARESTLTQVPVLVIELLAC